MTTWITLLFLALLVSYLSLGITGLLAARMLLDRLNRDAQAEREAWQDVSEQMQALYELLKGR